MSFQEPDFVEGLTVNKDELEVNKNKKELIKKLVDEIPDEVFDSIEKKIDKNRNKKNVKSYYEGLCKLEQFQFLEGYCDCYFVLAFNLFVYEKINNIIDNYNVKRERKGKRISGRSNNKIVNHDEVELLRSFKINKRMEKYMKAVEFYIKSRNKIELIDYLGSVNKAICKQILRLNLDEKLKEKGIYLNICSFDKFKEIMVDVVKKCPDKTTIKEKMIENSLPSK